jgi:hypothetical protein
MQTLVHRFWLSSFCLNLADGTESDSYPLKFNSPRYSAWYAVGLLARNEEDDVEIASQIIQTVIKYQVC